MSSKNQELQNSHPYLIGKQPIEWLFRYRENNTLYVWILFGTVGLILLYKSIFIENIAWYLILFLIPTGALTWTFFEYILHRFALHYIKENEWVKRWHHFVHGKHHTIPRDLTFVTASPIVTILPALSFFVVFYLILGSHLVWPFFAGFGFGYMLYEYTHHAIHKYPRPPKIVKPLWENHLIHHYKHPDKRFGVTNTIWDRVFGTYK